MITAKIDRFWRWVILGFVFSLLFPDARAYILVILIFGVYFYLAFNKFQWQKPAAIGIAVVLALVLFGINHYSEMQIEAAQQEALEIVEDGRHTGVAEGFRDDVEVEVEIEDGLIVDFAVEEDDTPDYGDKAAEEMTERILEAQSLEVDTVSGATITSEAIIEAAEEAIQPEEKEVEPGALASFIAFFTSGLWALPTLYQLVVVFIGIIVIDFVLQSVLVPKTGESLNCMNCQACVGVCPVRHVEGGIPLPMQMALSARMGDYEEVKRLLDYCVGCGRCSGRCPNGVSPVMLAGRAKVIDDKLKEGEGLDGTS